LLSETLREKGCEVISWIENNYGEDHNHVTKKFDFETWVNSAESEQSFEFDTNGATKCDLFIYYGPAGKDAAAEMGAAWAAGRTMIGLWAKGEDFGLMRKMIPRKYWFTRTAELVECVKQMKKQYDLIFPLI
jgi:hypothetical protein